MATTAVSIPTREKHALSLDPMALHRARNANVKGDLVIPLYVFTASHLTILVLFPRELSHESDLVLLEKPSDHGHQ